MNLENLVWDARDPHRLGAFWAAALGATPMTDEPEGFEARLELGGDLFLDLCFQRVAEPSASPARLHPDLLGGPRQAEGVDRLLDLGAERADTGKADAPWAVLADPEGNRFCVRKEDEAARGTGPIAALLLDSVEPERDAAFWAAITGWVPHDGSAPASLRHASGRGPVLELYNEPEPKRGKNRLHLDVRPAPQDDDPQALVRAFGGHLLDEAGDLPWRVYTDPSGNECCVLNPSP